MRVLALLALVGYSWAFPNGMPFCTLRPQVQSSWAELQNAVRLVFNQTCYNPGDELIVSLQAAPGKIFHGFVIRSDAGHFVRRHGFGGYRWLGDEQAPDQSCITHVYPGPNQENGLFDKTGVVAKLLVPDNGRATPTRIIVEATSIESFDEDKWSREWSEGVYSIARGSINLCRTAFRLPALKISEQQPSARKTASRRTAPRRPASVKRTSPAQRTVKKFKPNSRCAKPSDPGRCEGNTVTWVQPYYFDASIKACRKFFYTGCGGNNNRFPTLEDCENWCLESNEPCSKKQNTKCDGEYSWKGAYYVSPENSQCVHYWYRSCSEEDLPQFPEEADCQSSCLGIEQKKASPSDIFLGPKGRCFELFDKDADMCPVWATKKICSPYPEFHNNHWAHFNCRLSCCKNHGL